MNNTRENNHDLFNEQDIQTWEEEDEEHVKVNDEKQVPPETIADKYSRSQLRVVRETKDFTLDYLKYALKIDSPIINVAPEYQRRQRWSLRKRSQLIESFLMNIPIPSIFLFEREYNKYEVVDGRQRLDTIREYLNDKFRLKGLDYWSELNGKSFQELPEIIKKGLLRRSLAAVVLLAETRNPEDDDFDVRRILFDRLNTGGEKLSPQELRNALYPGNFNKMLIKLARSDEFTKTWGIPSFSIEEDEYIPENLAKNALYKNMADCELVLRFFAIEEAIKRSDRGSLKKLLDSCMERHYKDAPHIIEGLTNRYQRYLRSLFDIFDERPFRIPDTARPSRTLYDAMMVAMSLLDTDELYTQRAQIQQRLQTALDDPEKHEFMVGSKGVSLDHIKQRVRIADTILTGKVSDDRLP